MRKIIIVSLLFIFLTGCTGVDLNPLTNKVDDVVTDINNLTDDLQIITDNLEDYDLDTLENDLGLVYAKMAILEDDLEGLTVEDVSSLEAELASLMVEFNLLKTSVNSLESDTTLDDRIYSLEFIMEMLMYGPNLKESDIKTIFENYGILTDSDFGFRYLSNFNSTSYEETCPGFLFYTTEPVNSDYCYDTSPQLDYYDTAFSHNNYNLSNFKTILASVSDLFEGIINYEDTPLVVGQNFTLDGFYIHSVDKNDTSLLFTIGASELTIDYKVLVAKDLSNQLFYLELIKYETLPEDNIQIKITLDYDFELVEIQLQDKSPTINGDTYYYSNYNGVQEFHMFDDDGEWMSLIQNPTSFVTTFINDLDSSYQTIRMSIHNDDGIVLMYYDDDRPMFFTHHTSFSNIKRIAIDYGGVLNEYLQYSDDSEESWKKVESIDEIHMTIIPGENYYKELDEIISNPIMTIFFYNPLVDLTSIETEYNVTFKYDKDIYISLLNSYINNPDYALELKDIEIEDLALYYRGFLLKD